MTIPVCFAMSISMCGTCYDLQSNKIKNWLILAGYGLGLGLQLWLYGAAGLGVWVSGSLMPAALLIPLFHFRMLGAGDIKLFSTLGGILGMVAILKCMLFSFLFGAILSIGVLILCRNTWSRLRYLADYISQYIKTKELKPYRKNGMVMEHIHFTVPIMMSVLLLSGGII
ncbi:MAG: prepilin peptidase [Lachnospiraceae bacterium]|jgi:prepilin peptidase CpaA|nr:prepilin peptidase [Lachnospiraceae bacterium]MDD3614831.1 prepilin peptidase [Lachnospiraceae bacterium]